MTRVTTFKLLALLLSLGVTAALLFGGVFGVLETAKTTTVAVPPLIKKAPVVQQVFGASAFEALMAHVSGDEFASVWDFDAEIMMSRTAFIEQEMFGQARYRYKANTRVATLHLWTGVSKQQLVLGLTPEIERLLEPMAKDVIHRADFQTDAHGLKPTEFTPRPGETVFLLGDSFTEGMWVEPRETFANLYGRRLLDATIPLAPVNLGVNGYSVMEMRWTLERFAPLLRPKVAILNLYPNDVAAEMTAAMTTPERLGASFAAMFESLDAVRAYCEAQGIRMVVALIPGRAQMNDAFRREHPVHDGFQREVTAWATRSKVPCVDALPYLYGKGEAEVYLSWDGHFSPRGHAHYADFLFTSTRGLLRP